MREIEFDFIYKTGRGLKHKKYALETIMLGIDKVCDLSDIGCELIATRQYTGLLDKNGVKIFEGDIVKIKYVSQPKEVKYSTVLASFLIGDDHRFTALQDIEVIGNKFENPELLNVEID